MISALLILVLINPHRVQITSMAGGAGYLICHTPTTTSTACCYDANVYSQTAFLGPTIIQRCGNIAPADALSIMLTNAAYMQRYNFDLIIWGSLRAS